MKKPFRHFDKKLNTFSNMAINGGKDALLVSGATGQPELAMIASGAIAGGKAGKLVSSLLNQKKRKRNIKNNVDNKYNGFSIYCVGWKSINFN
jgi:hypothetical protein